jgi:uroporphyrinogen-III synthase
MLPLQGVGVLITRPEQQAMPLCRLLEMQGAHTRRLPVIDIRACGERRAPGTSLGPGTNFGALENFDLIVFVSANAVRFGAGLLNQRRDLPLAAIGPATARALNQSGYRVALQPEQYDTEGLLQHPRLQHLAGQRILLIQGKGGRPLLQQELERRGAQVLRLEVYERVPAQVSAAALAALQDALAAGEIQVVTATNLDIGGRLLELASGALRGALQRALWLVPSERVAAGLRELGLNAALLQAASAQDQDLVSALLVWRAGASLA